MIKFRMHVAMCNKIITFHVAVKRFEEVVISAHFLLTLFIGLTAFYLCRFIFIVDRAI